ncbi:hypothetical protein [Gemmatimonas sp.]|uniref:hypothetical protein n=1 Tax=Gemmatimonas sp. TaxID=1962908 RepID=UPI0025C1D2AC|nr:hypothetical protein [Gemmatimonas sp.]MCA2992822.1 hypothetical protein [Gemmatimonas sp.]
MRAASSSSPRSFRVRYAAVIAALIAVGVSARSSRAAQVLVVQPPSQPAVPAAPATDSSAGQASAAADTLAVSDSLAPAVTDASQPVALKAAAPAPAAPAAWPVDPVTGQTLINGRPVVGRVFIMKKTDGTVKYPNVADVIAHEALAPLPPVVGSSYTPAPITNQRRMRGIMIQSTLWDIDAKRSAVRHRYYPASTPANQLGQ